MERQLVYGGIYKHFKDKLYQVKCVAYHSESKERMVVYQALYGDYSVYVRPFDMFMSEVDHVKYPEVTQKYRFELVGQIDASEITYKQEDTTSETSHKTVIDIKPENPVNMDTVDRADDVSKIEESTQPEDASEAAISEKLVAFLDADTYKEKLDLLNVMKAVITDAMIDTMAVSLDTSVPEGEIKDRFNSLKNYLATQVKYEIVGNRFR